MGKIFTTRTGARALGIKQDTLKCYANRYGYGFQPGGPGTPYLFTLEDLLSLRDREYIVKTSEEKEDREALELGPMYNPDGSPNIPER